MIGIRDKLFKNWKNKPDHMNLRKQYNKFRNRLNKYINKAKSKYRQELEIKNCKKNISKIWTKINSWIDNEKRSVDSVILKYLGKL